MAAMKVPFPETVEISDYEIGMALRADVMGRHEHCPALTIWVSNRPWGEALDWAHQWEVQHIDDAAMARTSNYLTHPDRNKK